MITFLTPSDMEQEASAVLYEGGLAPRLSVVGIGGAGGNAVNNMIRSELDGVDFIAANTDAQALAQSLAGTRVQLGKNSTRGLGAGSRPEVGREAAEEDIDEILEHIAESNMVFLAAGMGGGTGTGATPVIAKATREKGILTVAVITKPFRFEGDYRMGVAEEGIKELAKHVDTLITIPNQNLFRISNETTSFLEAFSLADAVLHQGVQGVTDLIMRPGLSNLDFSDINTGMSQMGPAIMGAGDATGDNRAIEAAESAISNPLLDDISLAGAGRVLINITGGSDLGLHEIDNAVSRIRGEVEGTANLIFGATYDKEMDGRMRVCVIASAVNENAAREEEKTTADLFRLVPGAVTEGLEAAATDSGQETDGQQDAASPLGAEQAVHAEEPEPADGRGVEDLSRGGIADPGAVQQAMHYEPGTAGPGSAPRAPAPAAHPVPPGARVPHYGAPYPDTSLATAAPPQTRKQRGLLSLLFGRKPEPAQPSQADTVSRGPEAGTPAGPAHGVPHYPTGEPHPQLGELKMYDRPRPAEHDVEDQRIPRFLREQAN